MKNLTTVALNSRVARLLDEADVRLAELGIEKHPLESGATVYDFGVNALGSIQAGLLLSRVCLADMAQVQLLAPNYAVCETPMIQVATDHAWLACMGSQYAGWPIKLGDYFGMGSGPMRLKRGREKLLEELQIQDHSNVVVGVIESDRLPEEALISMIAEECRVQPQQVILCVAPTTSIAGSMQIVARCVETALHKVHTLGGDVTSIASAIGWAPLPAPARKFVAALGRTNDAILYAGHVTLWVRDEGQLLSMIETIPSCSSSDFGKPFAEIFAAYEHDFYKIDPNLFAPAMITINDMHSGQTKTAGHLASLWKFL